MLTRDSFSVAVYALFTCVAISQHATVSGSNSPQMIFYTPPSHESYIYLESKYGYSATLNLRRPRPVPSSPLTTSGHERRKVSEFIVMGPEYPLHGVSAVIQSMNLRMDSGNNACRDFIQFGKNASESERSDQLCGFISTENDSNNTGVNFQRTFFSPDGRVHIYFYSDHSQNENDILIQDLNELDIGAEIVFTAYTVCPTPANSWKKLQACSTTEKMSCIYSTLFCDSKVDCGFPGEFGIDEVGCYLPYIYMSASIIGGVLLTVALIVFFIRWVTKIPKRYRLNS